MKPDNIELEHEQDNCLNIVPVVSLVVPLYNEEDVLQLFYESICTELEKYSSGKLKFNFQIIFVNDGSQDSSEGIIRRLAQEDSRVEGILLARNFGHQAALTAGLDCATGDAVICMDADLQHPPAVIGSFLNHWLQGYDIVYTIRKEADEKVTWKKLTSSMFYKIINLITDTPIHPSAADFRLIDKRVADVLRHDIRERHRFIRGLVNWVGFRTVGLEFEVASRASGYSKYSFSKMLRLATDGVISFSIVPLKLGIYIGSTLALASLVYGAYAIIAAVLGFSVPGWASLLAVITFLGAVQIFLIGLLGFYVGYLFEEAKGRPIYIIRERVASSLQSHDIRRLAHLQNISSKEFISSSFD